MVDDETYPRKKIRAAFRAIDDNLDIDPGSERRFLKRGSRYPWAPTMNSCSGSMATQNRGMKSTRAGQWKLSLAGFQPLEVMGTAFQRGRFFTAQDDEHSPDGGLAIYCLIAGFGRFIGERIVLEQF